MPVRGIPRMERENGWTSQDEANLPVLRAARRVHTAYTAGWNDRYREEDIDRDLYGNPGEAHDDYSLRSSLRLAVSIPWKMRIAEASSAEELYDRLKDDGAAVDGHSVREYLAWQEHRSWQAFMTLEGWRMPSEEEMREYLFRNGNDHRNKVEKLHPCLCDLEDDWFNEERGRRSLSRRRHSEWSAEFANVDARNHYSKLDQMSMTVHHICKEIVLSDDYRSQMRDLFSGLEQKLIESCQGDVSPHFQRLRLAEKMFDRLQRNESNSYHPFAQARSRFIEGVREDININDVPSIEAACQEIEQASKVAVERNKYRNYKEIDSQIIDWLPWIIDETRVDTIWKIHSERNPFLNLVSALKIRPRRLALLHGKDQPIQNTQMNLYREFLSQHGAGNVDVVSMPILDACKGGFARIGASDGCRVIDASEMSDYWQVVPLPDDMRVISVQGRNLRSESGASKWAEFFHQRTLLTVDEALKLRGRTVLSVEDSNELLGMEEDYKNLWEVCRNQKNLEIRHDQDSIWKPNTNNWDIAIGTGLSGAENRIRMSIFRGENAVGRRLDRNISMEAYEQLVRNGGLQVLFDLQRRGAIADLSVNPNQGNGTCRISARHFPDRSNDYSQSLDTIENVLRHPEVPYAFDDEYVPFREPLQVFDLSKAISYADATNRNLRRKIGEKYYGVTSADIDGIKNVIKTLVGKGLLLRDGDALTYKSGAVRHGLKKEGFALEAYVYYTLFLSGIFDDVRGNVRIQRGAGGVNGPEKEMDVIVVQDGRMGFISCKDTSHISGEHIYELADQAESYGIRAKPILVCSKADRIELGIRNICAEKGICVFGSDDLSKKDFAQSISSAICRRG